MSQSRTLGGILRRAIWLQTLLVAAAIGLGIAGVLRERSVASSERQSRQILLSLESFEFQVLNAESGFRGFALVHREPFLVPYRQAFPAIAALRRTLMPLVDDADRPYMHEAFRVIADWRRNFAEPALRSFRAGQDEAARKAIRRGEGKRRIDRIRVLADRIRANEREDLAAASDLRRLIGASLVALLALALVAAIAAGARLLNVTRRTVVDPIAQLAATTRRIRAGELGARAEVSGSEEVCEVAESLNAMADEVQSVVAGLREVDELKTRFLSTVSHELRTPLTSITGYLQLLEQGVVGELEPDQLRYVRVAQRNGERLAALIDDLLMLSRFDAGRIDIASGPVDLATQLRNLREEMQPVAAKRETRLELDTPDELVIEGDARRLQQSFANLVSNAIKFNREGGEVRISAAAMNGDAIVEVSDEGVGIPPAELDRIGERFFRASTTHDLPGTGLGLAITREIVERHGGTLEIESEVGQGSKFRIRLPRAAQAARSRSSDASSSASSASAASSPSASES